MEPGDDKVVTVRIPREEIVNMSLSGDRVVGREVTLRIKRQPLAYVQLHNALIQETYVRLIVAEPDCFCIGIVVALQPYTWDISSTPLLTDEENAILVARRMLGTHKITDALVSICNRVLTFDCVIRY